jgi:hypothetical protein
MSVQIAQHGAQVRLVLPSRGPVPTINCVVPRLLVLVLALPPITVLRNLLLLVLLKRVVGSGDGGGIFSQG